MSSVPPFTPPGGGAPPPYPPYDPKTQWRVYREQQKAAWRAQREAWKAQRVAAKAGYASAWGPRVPSVVGPIILIGVGIVALLVVTGRIASEGFWTWYGHWWPLLLIGAGTLLLAEWAIDMRRETPVRRSGSFVGILIFLAILGIGASGWNGMRPWMHWDDHGGDFFKSFGLPEHDNDLQLLNTQIGANAQVEIQNPRGDVSVTAGDGPNIEVQAHEVAYSGSDSDARKILESEKPNVKVTGNNVLVTSEGNNSGRVNIAVTVPKSAHVTVNAGHGDVTGSGLGAGMNITARGDVHLSSVAGTVGARFTGGKHDFSAHDIQGDVTTDGDCDNLTFSEIRGKITQSGEILGDVHIESVTGPIHLHTSVTDLTVAELPGDLTLNSDDLRINQAKGQVRVVTHSKDIDLSQIYGDSYTEDRDGRISVEPAGNYSVEAKNNKGDVELTLPPNAAASVNARTHNGEIISDFAMPSAEGENKTASFTIGSGGARIVLSADNGDVHIKKGSEIPPPPPATPAAEAVKGIAAPPAAPAAPKAPHLTPSKKTPDAQPVTQ